MTREPRNLKTRELHRLRKERNSAPQNANTRTEPKQFAPEEIRGSAKPIRQEQVDYAPPLNNARIVSVRFTQARFARFEKFFKALNAEMRERDEPSFLQSHMIRGALRYAERVLKAGGPALEELIIACEQEAE